MRAVVNSILVVGRMRYWIATKSVVLGGTRVGSSECGVAEANVGIASIVICTV